MLKTLSLVGFLAASAISSFAQVRQLPDDKLSFTTSKAPFEFVLNAKGYVVQKQQQAPDGSRGYFHMTNDLVNVSFWFEPVDKCKTSKECRDMIFKAGNPSWGEYQNLLLSEIGDTSFFEFFRPTVMNRKVDMLDMYAEFVREGIWIDLHITKLLYTKKDHAIFEDMVKSAQFVGKKGANTALASD